MAPAVPASQATDESQPVETSSDTLSREENGGGKDIHTSDVADQLLDTWRGEFRRPVILPAGGRCTVSFVRHLVRITWWSVWRRSASCLHRGHLSQREDNEGQTGPVDEINYNEAASSPIGERDSGCARVDVSFCSLAIVLLLQRAAMTDLGT